MFENSSIVIKSRRQSANAVFTLCTSISELWIVNDRFKVYNDYAG